MKQFDPKTPTQIRFMEWYEEQVRNGMVDFKPYIETPVDGSQPDLDDVLNEILEIEEAVKAGKTKPLSLENL